MKRAILIFVIFILITIHTKVAANEEHYKIHFMDIGQSDCILIQGMQGNYLIDTGLPESYPKVSAYLKRQGVTSLKNVIITHLHDDHYGGFENLIHDFKVENILIPNHQKLLREYLFSFLNTAKGVKVGCIKQGLIVNTPKVSLRALLPQKEDLEIENNNGIVLIGIIDGITYVFMADVERQRESEIVKNKELSSCDVLKVPHHGLDTSSTLQLINLLRPRAAVITCSGTDSPSSEVLGRYSHSGAAVFRTDIEGNIIITSGGKDKSIEIICDKMIK